MSIENALEEDPLQLMASMEINPANPEEACVGQEQEMPPPSADDSALIVQHEQSLPVAEIILTDNRCKDLKMFDGDLDPSGKMPHGFGEYIYEDGSVYEVLYVCVNFFLPYTRIKTNPDRVNCCRASG